MYVQYTISLSFFYFAFPFRSALSGSALHSVITNMGGFTSSTLTALPLFKAHSSVSVLLYIYIRLFFVDIIFFFFSLIRSGCITTVTCHFIVSVYSFWSFLMAECICIYDERYLAFESIVNMYRLTKPFYGMCWRENCYYFSTNKIFVLFYGHSWFYFSNINKPAVCQMVEISSK